MSAAEHPAKGAFRRIGKQHLKCRHCPAFTEHVEWVNYDDAEMLNNELPRLEGKNWWRGRADTEEFLWYVNEMRREDGLPPLVLRAYPTGAGNYFEEGRKG
jgi:hypothetical protein